ncbi:MAG: hypothetical protein IKL79_05070 [Clostridia bacterium]|nr:hypothetical protein [Clostridia bacterium]
MKNKSVILSRTAITFLVGSLIFAGFAVYFFVTPSLMQTQKTWGWLSVVCAVFFLLSTLMVPLFYVVDKKGIRIRYITGDKENYEWKNVEGVVAEYDTLVPFIFDTYRIDGDDYTVYMFYKEGRMERSAALARAIKFHSGKAVVGLIPDGLSAGAARRFKISYGKAPNSDAAQAAERAVRKTVRDAAASVEGAKGASFSYSYVTKDGGCEKRPYVDYTYILTVKGEEKTPVTVTLLSVKRKGNNLKVIFEADRDTVAAELEKAF